MTAGLPAVAQFEVSPDHFPDPPQDHLIAATQSHSELQAKIAASQRELDGLEAQIRRQAEAVENARELAAGAGGMGDSASVFIDDYLQKYRDLEQLRRDLAPRIAQAQAVLDALNVELKLQLAAYSNAEPVTVGRPFPSASFAVKSHVPGGKPTAAKRKPQSDVLSASARVSR